MLPLRGTRGYDVYAAGMEASAADKAKLLHFVRPGIIADLGCGSGTVLELLRRKFRKSQLVGVDFSPEMIERSPYLPRFTVGGEGNPLGARALYLSGSFYRIHGTNAPWSIGSRATSGCIRMVNDDVIDLYSRVKVGTKVIVLPATEQRTASGFRAFF